MVGSSTIEAQDAPMQGYKTMNVKVKDKLDKNLSITVTSETPGNNPKRLYEIADAIKFCEEILATYNFTVVSNSQAQYVLNQKDDTEYFKSKEELKIPNKDSIAFGKPESESYYVMNLSLDYLPDGTIPVHMLSVTIYENKSKKIIASGQVEDYRYRLKNKFEKHIKRFIEDLEYQ